MGIRAREQRRALNPDCPERNLQPATRENPVATLRRAMCPEYGIASHAARRVNLADRLVTASRNGFQTLSRTTGNQQAHDNHMLLEGVSS
jgi:hypothetical protein